MQSQEGGVVVYNIPYTVSHRSYLNGHRVIYRGTTQLCRWMGHGVQSGPTWARVPWPSDVNAKTSFGCLVQTSGVVCLIVFDKSKRELVWPNVMCLAMLANIRGSSDNSDA